MAVESESSSLSDLRVLLHDAVRTNSEHMHLAAVRSDWTAVDPVLLAVQPLYELQSLTREVAKVVNRRHWREAAMWAYSVPRMSLNMSKIPAAGRSAPCLKE